MCTTVSYKATISAVNEISMHRVIPLNAWIEEGIDFKFIGDNVDKKKGVRDIRTEFHGEMKHMYSMIAVRSRVTSDMCESTARYNLASLRSTMFLPTAGDVHAIKNTLVVLVSRILCHYIKCLTPFSTSVPTHIPHVHSEQMAKRSETVVLDVLAKNEAKHSDMIDIMTSLQGYLGEAFPTHHKVLSGGDQLTCERQVCAQRHMMDGNTSRERLSLLEPVCEDWHCLMSFLGVSY